MTEPYELPELKCLRCGGTWNPRNPTAPKNCPICKSPYWDKARKEEKVDLTTA